MTEVKRDFVLMVELFLEPTCDQIIEAIAKLRDSATKEFGEGFVERVDIIGEQRYASSPYGKIDDVPTIIFRAYPPNPTTKRER